jgi:hypothetical protein
MAVGFPTKVNFATGDVLTAQNMNDLSGTVNLLESAQYAAGKNKVINGDFSINQRNFTSTTTTVTYGFDRFNYVCADGTVTYSAQTFTPGTAPVVGYEAANFARLVTTGQTLTTAEARLRHAIEDVRTLAGQTATISFWAKAASGTPKIAVELIQSFGTGGSPSAGTNTYAGQATLSTSWARYSVTVAIPSISGKTIGTTANTSFLGVNLWTSAGSTYNSRTGSLGIQSNTFDIWGVQVEAGSTASPFQTATGTLQGELAACQRYYWRVTPGTSLSRFLSQQGATGATDTYGTVNNPVSMRVHPTSVDFSALSLVRPDTTAFAVTTLTISASLGTVNNSGIAASAASGLTSNIWYVLATSSVSGYIGFSAEL